MCAVRLVSNWRSSGKRTYAQVYKPVHDVPRRIGTNARPARSIFDYPMKYFADRDPVEYPKYVVRKDEEPTNEPWLYHERDVKEALSIN